MPDKVIVKETQNKVIIGTPGIQGPRGRTILNGVGAPASNLGLTGDFYYDIETTRFYGPKLSDVSWAGAQNYILNNPPSDYAKYVSWELAEVYWIEEDNCYGVDIQHNLNFFPNVTCKDSTKDVVETGITYHDANKITLTMTHPFSGTAYLS